MEID
jgi:hypothetical protein